MRTSSLTNARAFNIHLRTRDVCPSLTTSEDPAPPSTHRERERERERERKRENQPGLWIVEWGDSTVIFQEPRPIPHCALQISTERERESAREREREREKERKDE